MKRKHIWILILISVLILISIPAFHILKTKWSENTSKAKTPFGYVNDASQLNLTKVDTIIPVLSEKLQIEKQLKEILKYAKLNNLKIAIASES